MAYVRQRGKQLAIVHGQRDPETGKVEQRILFTIYSRAEARELLGGGAEGGQRRFRAFMEHCYPEMRFRWKEIRSAIAGKLDVLPETYEYDADRLGGQFRSDLCAFTRQIALADPQWLFSAAQIIKAHRHELAFVRELVDWRLSTCDREETEWGGDDPFHWRFALSGREVPGDVEEMASVLYEKGRLEEARAAFRLLIESFEGYAEGHNYLGLIALAREELAEAIREFERTVDLARRKFRRRIAKRDYGDVLETRPYLRGLSNLCITLSRAGRHGEALAICDRLERETGDDIAATAHRAAIYLNMGRWAEALSAGDRLHRLYAEENLVAGFAAFELGHSEEAAWRFLHAALNHPRAARMIVGLKTPALSRSGYEDVRDHNAGVDLLRDLRGFLSVQSPSSRRFFRELLRRPDVEAILFEKAAVVERWSGPHKPEEEWRRAFDRMQLMETPEFARQQSERFLPPGGGVGARGRRYRPERAVRDAAPRAPRQE